MIAARPLIAGAAFAVCWACGVPTPAGVDAGWSPGDGTPATIELAAGARVEYALAWAWDDAPLRDGRRGFVNDLGYEIEIDRLAVVAYSAQLGTCEPVAAWSWGPAEARADHVSVDDPSVVIAPLTEEGLTSEPRALGVGVAAGGTYCNGFLLEVPIDAATAPTMAGNGLIVTGWYRAPGGERVAMDGRIPLGDGGLRVLAAADPEVIAMADGEGALAARVVFTRHPTAAFAGIAPDQLTHAELGWAVLRGLFSTSTARWQRAP